MTDTGTNPETFDADAAVGKSNQPDGDPLHGVTLQMMVERLEDELGWEGLAEKIHIRCFDVDPSVGSSLKFLRRTPWARQKVELLYLYVFHKKKAGELAKRRRSAEDHPDR
jgi:uncharacterized protein (DUF2132 family)